MTWSSVPPLSAKPPCLSSTPTTSNSRRWMVTFWPSGDTCTNRFVATSAPMTQTGRPLSHSADDRKRPSSTVRPLVIWKCSVVPIKEMLDGTAFFELDEALILRDRRDGGGELQLPLQRVGIVERDRGTLSRIQPFLRGLNEPAVRSRKARPRRWRKCFSGRNCSGPRWPCPSA